MAVYQVLLDQRQGPLPIKGQFEPKGDNVPSLFFNGTASAARPGASLTVQVQIVDQDGKDAGSTSAIIVSNEAHQHKTLLAMFINQKPFAFGSTYTFYVTAATTDTLADENDYYSLMIAYS